MGAILIRSFMIPKYALKSIFPLPPHENSHKFHFDRQTAFHILLITTHLFSIITKVIMQISVLFTYSFLGARKKIFIAESVEISSTLIDV